MKFLLWLLFVFTCISVEIVVGGSYEDPTVYQIYNKDTVRTLSGVMLTTGKDTRAFEKSMISVLKYLVDVDKFYVLTPNAIDVDAKLGKLFGPRVVFVDEKIFPFSWQNISEIMIGAVAERGVYPLNNGKSQFENTVNGRIGWFLQQLLKFYAGKVLNLSDFVLLDSDIVFFKNITLINGTTSTGGTRYNYASSSQYHPPYMATLSRVSGEGPLKVNEGETYRSGICHHMVIVKSVLEDLVNQTQHRYRLPFWQVLLNESAIEMTCRAPKAGICGAGSTLSEYEMYFNYARVRFPETVSIRPLLWANGPAPGLLFWPQVEQELQSDGPKKNWLGHRQVDVPEALGKQMVADAAQGFDYVGYHAYAKRRYFEMVGPDITALCEGVEPPHNSTCSWRGLDESKRSVADWFRGCGCYMANHQSGP